MNHWAKRVLQTLQDSKVSVKLAKLYVDDVRWVLEYIKRGWRYVKEEGMLIYDPGFEEDDQGLSDYEYTSLVLREIMISISDDLTFTSESQGDFANNFLPTLNFQGQLCPKSLPWLQYKFFKKEMSSKLSILQTSALPENEHISELNMSG